MVSRFSQIIEIVSLRNLGFGFYWGWIYVSFSSLIFFSFDESDILLDRLCSVTSLLFFVGALWVIYRLQSTVSLNSAYYALTAALSVAGTALLAVSSIVSFFPVLMVGLGLMGIASALLIVGWGCYYSTMDLKTGCLLTSASFVVAVLIYFLILDLSKPIASVVCVLLPLASTVLLRLAAESQSVGEADLEEKTPRQDAKRTGLSWKLLLGVVLCSGIIGVMKSIYALIVPYQSMTYEFSFLVSGIVATVLFVASLVLFRRSENLYLVFFLLTIPVISLSFLLLPLVGFDSPLVFGFVNIGETCLNILLWCVLLGCAKGFGRLPVAVFSFGWLAITFGRLMGELAGAALIQIVSLGETGSLVLSGVSVLIVVVAAPFLFSEGLLSSNEIHSQSALERALQEKEERTQAHLEELGSRFGLTNREVEVLALLEKGKSVKQIEKELHIANATVQTHKRSIYLKLSVHSKEELLDLIESD